MCFTHKTALEKYGRNSTETWFFHLKHSKFCKKSETVCWKILYYLINWLSSQIIWHRKISLFQFMPCAGIYPRTFTNVHFWTKIELLNVLFHERWSQNNCKMQVGGERWCNHRNRLMVEPWWRFWSKAPEKFWLFNIWGANK